MAQLKAIEKNFLKKLENKANNIVDAVYVQIKEIAEQQVQDENKLEVNKMKKQEIFQLEQKGKQLFK